MPPRLLSGPFLRVTIANFFFFLNFASFFLLPLRITGLGGSEAMVGAVMGTFGVAALLTLPLVGLTIDRFGRRRFLMIGTVGMAAASAGYLFADRLGPLLFALRALQGISFACAFTATTTFAATFAPLERRAQALGIFGLSTLLTHAIAPTMGEFVIQSVGFNPLFCVATVCTLITLVLAVPLPRHPGRSVADPAEAPLHFDRLFWVVGVTTLLAAMGFGTVITFIPTFVRTEGLGQVGFFFAAYTTTAILSRLVGAGLSDSFGRRRVILPTLFALGVAILILAFVHGVPLLVIAGLLFGAAQGMSYPTMHAFVVDLTAEANLGRAQALFNGAFNLGVTSSAFVFGLVAESFGHRVMFAAAATTPVFAWAVFYLYGMPARGEVPCESSSILSSAKPTESASR